MKTRIEKESNYKGIWFDSGFTFRVPLNPSKDISELKNPEFYDIKVIDQCQGKCPWCYQSSTPKGDRYTEALQNIKGFLGALPVSERPFQIAYGGGEPTEHPDFHEILRVTKEFGVTPNFTTNGQWVDRWSDFEISEHLQVVKEFCGGVALSTHPHLVKAWTAALELYAEAGIRVNLHHIISDRRSIVRMCDILEKFSCKIDYVVLLPLENVGRSKKGGVDYDALDELLPRHLSKKLAWGANFYDYLRKGTHGLNVSLYPPEMFSKYLDLKGRGTLYASSFSKTPIMTNVIQRAA